MQNLRDSEIARTESAGKEPVTKSQYDSAKSCWLRGAHGLPVNMRVRLAVVICFMSWRIYKM